MKYLLSLLFFLGLLCTAQASPNSVLAELHANGVTTGGGTTNYAFYLPQLNSNGVLNLLMMPPGVSMATNVQFAWLKGGPYDNAALAAALGQKAPYSITNSLLNTNAYVIINGVTNYLVNSPSFSTAAGQTNFSYTAITNAPWVTTNTVIVINGETQYVGAADFTVTGVTANQTNLWNDVTNKLATATTNTIVFTNTPAYVNLLTNTATAAQGALADTALQHEITNGVAFMLSVGDDPNMVNLVNINPPADYSPRVNFVFGGGQAAIGLQTGGLMRYSGSENWSIYDSGNFLAGVDYLSPSGSGTNLTGVVLTNDTHYLAALTNIPTGQTNLPAGTLAYVGGTLYGGTNIVAAGALTNAVAATNSVGYVTNINGVAYIGTGIVAGVSGAITNGQTGVVLGSLTVPTINNSLYTYTAGVDKTATMTGNASPSNYVYASSDAAGAYRAFDKASNSYWNGTFSSGVWLMYRFQTPWVVNKYTFAEYSPCPGSRLPSTWTIWGSSDSNSWTLLDTRINGYSGMTAGTVAAFNMNNTNSFSYYKITVSNIVQNDSGEVQISEMQWINSNNYTSTPNIVSSVPSQVVDEYGTNTYSDPSSVTKVVGKSIFLTSASTTLSSDLTVQGYTTHGNGMTITGSSDTNQIKIIANTIQTANDPFSIWSSGSATKLLGVNAGNLTITGVHTNTGLQVQGNANITNTAVIGTLVNAGVTNLNSVYYPVSARGSAPTNTLDPANGNEQQILCTNATYITSVSLVSAAGATMGLFIDPTTNNYAVTWDTNVFNVGSAGWPSIGTNGADLVLRKCFGSTMWTVNGPVTNSYLSGITTGSTNLPAGTLAYVGGTLYGGTNDNDGAYINTNDSRLTDARTPLAHTQSVTTITGLGDAALSNAVDFATAATNAALAVWSASNTVANLVRLGALTNIPTDNLAWQSNAVDSVARATFGGYVATNNTHYLAALTNIPTGQTNLPAGTLAYVGGKLYGGTNDNDGAYINTNRTITVNGVTQMLSSNLNFTVSGLDSTKVSTNTTVTINGVTQKLSSNLNFNVSGSSMDTSSFVQWTNEVYVTNPVFVPDSVLVDLTATINAEPENRRSVRAYMDYLNAGSPNWFNYTSAVRVASNPLVIVAGYNTGSFNYPTDVNYGYVYDLGGHNAEYTNCTLGGTGQWIYDGYGYGGTGPDSFQVSDYQPSHYDYTITTSTVRQVLSADPVKYSDLLGPPATNTLTVSGAGTEQVNGTYTWDGVDRYIGPNDYYIMYGSLYSGGVMWQLMLAPYGFVPYTNSVLLGEWALYDPLSAVIPGPTVQSEISPSTPVTVRERLLTPLLDYTAITNAPWITPAEDSNVIVVENAGTDAANGVYKIAGSSYDYDFWGGVVYTNTTGSGAYIIYNGESWDISLGEDNYVYGSGVRLTPKGSYTVWAGEEPAPTARLGNRINDW